MSEPYYADDLVTLYHGDCQEQDDWLAADVLITDPPYGVGYTGKRGGTGRESRGATKVPVAGDGDFMVAASAIAAWHGGPVAAFANHRSLPQTLAAVRAKHERARVLTWHKTNVNGAAGMGNPWFADVEFAVCGVPEWPKRAASGLIQAKRFTGNPAWQKNNPEAYLHPTQKPVVLMEQLILRMPPGVVADPFAGSGSTLVAARNLGRRSVGVEIDERYCEVVATRLSAMTLDLGA